MFKVSAYLTIVIQNEDIEIVNILNICSSICDEGSKKDAEESEHLVRTLYQ